jgi:hypothetical protein
VIQSKENAMPLSDAYPTLGFAKGVRTDTASTDAAVINIPVNGAGFVVKYVTVYNASGDNSSATLGVFTAAGGSGATIVANAALTTHTGATVVSERTVAATAVTPVVTADNIYIRVGTASGVSGSTIDVAVHGYCLP